MSAPTRLPPSPLARCTADSSRWYRLGGPHLGFRQMRAAGELLGHADVSTTDYTHVLDRGPLGVRSPGDRLL